MALTKISSTTSATTVLAANTARRKSRLLFENSDTNRCYVLVGDPNIVGAPSATNYSFSLAQNDPAELKDCMQAVQCVWGTAGTGALMVTEYID
jgi:hypothetical protein